MFGKRNQQNRYEATGFVSLAGCAQYTSRGCLRSWTKRGINGDTFLPGQVVLRTVMSLFVAIERTLCSVMREMRWLRWIRLTQAFNSQNDAATLLSSLFGCYGHIYIYIYIFLKWIYSYIVEHRFGLPNVFSFSMSFLPRRAIQVLSASKWQLMFESEGIWHSSAVWPDTPLG